MQRILGMPWSAKSFWTVFRNNSSLWFAFPLHWLSSAFWPVKHFDFWNVIVNSVLRHRGWGERGYEHRKAGCQRPAGRSGDEQSQGCVSEGTVGACDFETGSMVVWFVSPKPFNPVFTSNEISSLISFPFSLHGLEKTQILQIPQEATVPLLLLFVCYQLWRTSITWQPCSLYYTMLKG